MDSPGMPGGVFRYFPLKCCITTSHFSVDSILVGGGEKEGKKRVKLTEKKTQWGERGVKGHVVMQMSQPSTPCELPKAAGTDCPQLFRRLKHAGSQSLVMSQRAPLTIQPLSQAAVRCLCLLFSCTKPNKALFFSFHLAGICSREAANKGLSVHRFQSAAWRIFFLHIGRDRETSSGLSHDILENQPVRVQKPSSCLFAFLSVCLPLNVTVLFVSHGLIRTTSTD